MNIVWFKLSFCIDIFCKLEFFQVFCFYKRVFVKSHFSITLFIGCQSHFDNLKKKMHNGCYTSERSSISYCDGWFGIWNLKCYVWSKGVQ
jgi:hypothetical protein